VNRDATAPIHPWPWRIGVEVPGSRLNWPLTALEGIRAGCRCRPTLPSRSDCPDIGKHKPADEAGQQGGSDGTVGGNDQRECDNRAQAREQAKDGGDGVAVKPSAHPHNDERRAETDPEDEGEERDEGCLLVAGIESPTRSEMPPMMIDMGVAPRGQALSSRRWVRVSSVMDGEHVRYVALALDRESTCSLDPSRWGRGIVTAAVQLFVPDETRRPVDGRERFRGRQTHLRARFRNGGDRPCVDEPAASREPRGDRPLDRGPSTLSSVGSGDDRWSSWRG
jgi:hypothetical protein